LRSEDSLISEGVSDDCANIGCSLFVGLRKGGHWSPRVPKTWDEARIASGQVPLVVPAASPKHISADYYHRIPVRPIYKGYPVYAPGREPAGYLEWLTRQEPVILWDDNGHAPPLKTEADWIRAGEIVFDAPIGFPVANALAGSREWFEKLGIPVAKDGALPGRHYIIREKGKVELDSGGSCADCHTRVMADGSIFKGAQSLFPTQRAFAYGLRERAAKAPDPAQFLTQLRGFLKGLHAAPWLRPDMEASIDSMSVADIAEAFEAVPGGTSFRHANLLLVTQAPDLVGIKDRRYLDRTGFSLHRDIGDLMRYAAMAQGADSFASFGGFIPADAPRFTQLPPPEKQGRYSDEQLYPLALWIYSLKPPANPNPFDTLAASGQRIFEREGCATCHTPPLYTNNKLTPATGFRIPPEHLKTYDILQVSVDTDSKLAMRTRYATGYYKVPSLKGVWYRGMFPHDGSCATLEDWFDFAPSAGRLHPDRLQRLPGGAPRRSGTRFGLTLTTEEKRALIAFLKTL
jgi:hypothetical protein